MILKKINKNNSGFKGARPDGPAKQAYYSTDVLFCLTEIYRLSEICPGVQFNSGGICAGIIYGPILRRYKPGGIPGYEVDSAYVALAEDRLSKGV